MSTWATWWPSRLQQRLHSHYRPGKFDFRLGEQRSDSIAGSGISLSAGGYDPLCIYNYRHYYFWTASRKEKLRKTTERSLVMRTYIKAGRLVDCTGADAIRSPVVLVEDGRIIQVGTSQTFPFE